MQSLPRSAPPKLLLRGCATGWCGDATGGAILSIGALLAAPLVGRAQHVSFALAHVTVIDMTGAPPQGRRAHNSLQRTPTTGQSRSLTTPARKSASFGLWFRLLVGRVHEVVSHVETASLPNNYHRVQS